MNKLARCAPGGVVLAALTAVAHGQWTYVNLHPPGAISSRALGTTATQQAGSVELFDTTLLQIVTHAAAWNGSAAGWVDLNPPGASGSSANGVAGSQVAGHALIAGWEAGTWSGTGASWQSLHPGPTAFQSVAHATTGSMQAGRVLWFAAQYDHACAWIGGSCIDLRPPNSGRSEAFAASGSQQAGVVFVNIPGNQTPHASLWQGSAASWVDLHPLPLSAANHSIARGLAPGQQVGFVYSDGIGHHASIWSGTAASWIDVHPTGTTASTLNATTGEFQAGWTEAGGARHAGVWAGTASSWIDLHAFLLAGVYSSSEALGIARAGATLYVAGYAHHAALNRDEAVLWTGPAAGLCYADCNADGSLTVADFGCFQTKFVAADPYADCNGDGRRTVADFGCFQTKFVAGCP